MSDSSAPSARSESEVVRRPDRPMAAGLAVGVVTLRLLAAGVAVLILAASWLYISAAVDAYAVHFCGWPATISCDPSPVWSLVPIGVGMTAASGALTALTWLFTSRGGLVAAAYPLWIVVFMVLVLVTWPRQFDQIDLVVLGGYAGLSIELIRRSAILWMPTMRALWSAVAASAAVTYLLLLGLLPTHLAGLAT